MDRRDTPRTPSVGAWTGVAAMAVAAFTVIEFVIRQIFVGSRPDLDATRALVVFAERTAAGTIAVITIDTFLMAALIVFFAAFRQLITQVRPDLDWVSALAYGSGLVFVAVTLVGDAMEGGAALDALLRRPDDSAIRALTEGHALMFGPIGCVLTALVAAASGYVIVASAALPRWTGTLAAVVAVLNVLAAVTTILSGGTSDDFRSIGGWGTAALATFPWLVWVVCVGVVVIQDRRRHHENAKAIASV